MKHTALSTLRSSTWNALPTAPGVYWWFFPESCLTKLQVADHCDVNDLQLRKGPGNTVCLYHGMANNLRGRIKWHAAQPLTESALRSGFLSTLRLTLLALTRLDYRLGTAEVDRFMDTLHISWAVSATEEEAAITEANELKGQFHFPLNIQGNYRPELALYIHHIKAARKAYKYKNINL